MHGQTFKCVSCATSERLLRRNLGTCQELQTWTYNEQCQFFKQINLQKQSMPNRRMSWQAIRGTLAKSLTDQRIHKWKNEVSGKELPLSVWVAQVWDEEVVKKQPCTFSDQLGVDVYMVAVREITWGEEFERVEKQILAHESAATQARNKKKKGKKGEAGQDDSSDADLDLPVAESCEAAGASDKAKKTAARKKLMQSNIALCNTAAKALGSLQSSVSSLTTLWEKTVKHHDNMSEGLKATYKEHKEKLETWGAAARLVVNTHENTRELWQGEGDLLPLPALPFSAEDMKTSMKVQQEVMKAIRSAVPKKEPKARAAPSGTAAAAPKKRAAPEEETAGVRKRRSQKGPE